MRVRIAVMLLALGLVLPGFPAAFAEDPPAPPAPPAPPPREPAPAPRPGDDARPDVPPGEPTEEPDDDEVLAVGVITGDLVNLRVGPRIDDAPVGQVPEDTVVLVVERSGDWLGVRLPIGFPAAVAGALTEPVGEHEVRITAERVNLRVRPPVGERAYPAFRDHPALGAVLTVIEREGDWLWVEAPEPIRAYVHARFVRELGSLSAEAERVEAARRERTRRNEALATARAAARSTKDEGALREEVSAVSSALGRLRAEGGYETSPVATLSDRLASKLESCPGASSRTKALAKSVLEDLEREIELRIAFHDELLASARTGTPKPKAPGPPAPAPGPVEATGVVRWEAAPGWEGGGAFVLWQGDKPTHALRWGKGDLKAFDGKSVKVKGTGATARLLGLPTLEVDAVTPAP